MGALLTTLNGHTDAVNSVTFSSDDTCIVSGSWDNSVCVWDASMGALLHVIQEQTQAFINSVASSSDGTCVVSCPEDESALVSDLSMGCPPVWDYTIHGYQVQNIGLYGYLITNALHNGCHHVPQMPFIPTPVL